MPCAAWRASYTEVEENETDLTRFRDWLAKITTRDYFGAPHGEQARAELARAEAAFAAFEAAALAAEQPADPTSGPSTAPSHRAGRVPGDRATPPVTIVDSAGDRSTGWSHQFAESSQSAAGDQDEYSDRDEHDRHEPVADPTQRGHHRAMRSQQRTQGTPDPDQDQKRGGCQYRPRAVCRLRNSGVNTLMLSAPLAKVIVAIRTGRGQWRSGVYCRIMVMVVLRRSETAS